MTGVNAKKDQIAASRHYLVYAERMERYSYFVQPYSSRRTAGERNSERKAQTALNEELAIAIDGAIKDFAVTANSGFRARLNAVLQKSPIAEDIRCVEGNMAGG